ncbi:hypothetical protein NDU88_010661 [Pleurodeles waltl]|uniref:Uncharacterized protein n=1 Tax=Pleurodeles waltl TaxID=8319 RepID=A0AAV7PZ21_PLEWA|nr:hypothetical protein NDU88_010661 [Pleurodeles waltl]
MPCRSSVAKETKRAQCVQPTHIVHALLISVAKETKRAQRAAARARVSRARVPAMCARAETVLCRALTNTEGLLRCRPAARALLTQLPIRAATSAHGGQGKDNSSMEVLRDSPKVIANQDLKMLLNV